MYPSSCCISVGKEHYPSSSIRKGVGVEEQERDLSKENILSESLLWWGAENILLLFKAFRKAFVCSGSIHLLVGSRERWEIVGKEKLMDFQGLFLPPTLVQLTIRRTFFITCSSYLFCQCQLIILSHFLSWLPGKMENSKSLHRHCQTDWIGGKMVMFFVRTKFKLLANLKPQVRCRDDFLKSFFSNIHVPLSYAEQIINPCQSVQPL